MNKTVAHCFTASDVNVKAFHFHWPNSSWATVILGDPEFIVISDHGTWGHIWNARGKRSMMEFVVQCDDDYFMGKLADGDREFDHEASMERLKSDVDEWIENNQFEDIDDLIEEVKQEQKRLGDMTEQFEFDHFLMDSKIASEVYENDYEQLPTEVTYPHALRCFVRHLWPDIKNYFTQIIREE